MESAFISLLWGGFGVPTPGLFLGVASAGGRTGYLCVSSGLLDCKSAYVQAAICLSPLTGWISAQESTLPKECPHALHKLPAQDNSYIASYCLPRVLRDHTVYTWLSGSEALTGWCLYSCLPWQLAAPSRLRLKPALCRCARVRLYPLSWFLGLLLWSVQAVHKVLALLVHGMGCLGELKIK